MSTLTPDLVPRSLKDALPDDPELNRMLNPVRKARTPEIDAVREAVAALHMQRRIDELEAKLEANYRPKPSAGPKRSETLVYASSDNTATTQTANPGTPQIGTLACDVERERFRWLWPGRLALGKITVLDGDPGLGKSTLYCDLAARLTSGRPMPLDEAGLNEPGSVVIVTCEDGIGDTIRPRLEEAGADLSRCLIIQTVPEWNEERGEYLPTVPTIPEHLPEIEKAVTQVGARLLIIDPLMAHLSGDVNSYRDQDVRRALAPLANMAERLDAATLVIRHLNKASGGHALYRGGGSIGIIGAARLGLLLGRTPDSPNGLVLAPTKTNISRRPASLALRVVSSPQDEEVGVIEWYGISTLTAEDLVQTGSKERGRPAEERTAAEDWLRDRLSDGEPHAARDLWEAAEEKGFSQRTVKRAIKSLGVVVEQQPPRPGGTWFWSLPECQSAIYPNIGTLGGDGAANDHETTPKPAKLAEFPRVPELLPECHNPEAESNYGTLGGDGHPAGEPEPQRHTGPYNVPGYVDENGEEYPF